MNDDQGDNKPPDDNISRLLSRSSMGDERAFVELVKIMEKRICAFFRKRGFSVYDSEDATQVAFINIFNSLSHYDFSRPAEPWLWTIARRVASDFFKRSQHDNAIIVCEDTVVEVPSERDVRYEVSFNEMLTWISCLPKLDYQVLKMAVLGLTSHEIAAHVRLSHAGVRQRLSRVRNKLRVWTEYSEAPKHPALRQQLAERFLNWPGP
jgi:RNA polymerase sigma factor (sigma-70 family)